MNNKAPREVCDRCGYFIIWKPDEEENLQAYDPVSDTIHRCPSEVKPIGPAITGKKITEFHLRSRRAVFTLEDMTLEIDAGGHELHFTLTTSNGVIHE